MKKIKKAVIPAAGLGTRMLPATKSIPKEMFPLINKPVIQILVEEAFNSGIEEILIIISSYKMSIISHFDNQYGLETLLSQTNKDKELAELKKISNFKNISFICQKEPLGLGDAILKSKNFVSNDNFAVLLGDDLIDDWNVKPALLECIKLFEKTDSSVLGIKKVLDKDISKYGIIDIDKKIKNDEFLLKGIIEKPSLGNNPSNYAVIGRYVLSPRIFYYLNNIEKGLNGELQLTDAIHKLMAEQNVYAKFLDNNRYDLGSKIDLIKAMVDIGLKDNELNDEIKEFIKNKNF